VLIVKRLKNIQVRAKREELKTEKRVKKLINPAILLVFKQTILLWVNPLIKQQELAPALTLVPEEVNNSAKELLLDALIGKAYKGNNIIKEPITI
jgi:hypothetical protein